MKILCRGLDIWVPEGVRGDVGQLLLVLLVVLPHKAPNHVVIVHAHFRRPVPFEKQEVGVPVHRDGGFLSPILQHPLQRPIDRLTHRDFPIAALGLMPSNGKCESKK